MTGQRDPLVNALVELLPATGEMFTTGDRERWVAAMDSALQFLYPPEWAPEARRRAREAAAAQFPTITAPTRGKVTIGVPPEGFEPVLIVPNRDPVPAGDIEAMRRHVERTLGEYGKGLTVDIDTTPLIEEAPSTTSAAVVDDESGGEASAGSGAGPAPDTSFARSVGSPPVTAPTSPYTAERAPTLAERLAAKGLVSDVEVPGRIDPPKPTLTKRQRANFVRQCVRDGIEETAEAEGIEASTLRRWMLEFPNVVRATEESIGIARPKGRS